MQNRYSLLQKAKAERILILDGAMGTMLQKFGFEEKDFRGTVFTGHPVELKGNNDVLNLTQPQAVLSVHRQYLEAGADIIETNTFNANFFSQSKYQLCDKVYELNRAGAAIARAVADAFTEMTPDKPRFVAGSMGPTGKMLSMSPSVSDPAFRDLTFDELADAYKTAAEGLLDGGTDILLIETIFDTLNAKAAIYAINRIRKERQLDIPVMISGTLSDASGRLLAGQNVEAFLTSVKHCPGLLSVGLNCALGATEMRPYIAELAAKAPCGVSAHPNAGLPDEQGNYTQTPEKMAVIMREFADDGLLNIAGGCCGTTPDHIRAIASAMTGAKPRIPVAPAPLLRLAGLDPLTANPDLPFLNVGERTNVAGSRKFLRLIREGKHEEAIRIARDQVENGACIIDINMDDAMLDSQKELTGFLLRLAGEPDIARVPVMIDSSSWNTILAGLKCVQGKCIVNSISLKEGEKLFLEHAEEAAAFGAVLLCMAFDEQGQADTLERRVSICRRMYHLLTEQAHIPPCDIIFDVNVFAVATGIPAHDAYGHDFIEAVRILKKEFPLCHFSGGISNISFSFRGNEIIRQALHSVFLYHAIAAGLDMGIVNPAQLAQYEELEPELKTAAEAVILNSRPDAAARLLELASSFSGDKNTDHTDSTPAWRSDSVEARVQYALLHGNDTFLKEDMAEALIKYKNPVLVIEGPLMDGMKEVGIRFGAGKMFLPQVVKTARVMKNAVSELMPAIKAAQENSPDRDKQKTVVLATVKGDVHDIGKNIIAVMLQCNNFRVIDLGVMTPCQTIIETAIREQADIIALSGLITPSLEEMGIVADELKRRNLNIPLMVGGAATSMTHTALKLCTRYPYVVYTSDASQCVPAAAALADSTKRRPYLENLSNNYEQIRKEYLRNKESAVRLTLAEANKRAEAWQISDAVSKPAETGIFNFDFNIDDILPLLNRDSLLYAWNTHRNAKTTLLEDVDALLGKMRTEHLFRIKATAGIFPAEKAGNAIRIYHDEERKQLLAELPFLRKQTLANQDDLPLCLSDFIAGKQDYLGLFALSAGYGIAERAEQFRKENDDYSALLLQTLAGAMADAAADYLQHTVLKEIWDIRGIRPAVGYPVCPDHTLKEDIFRVLNVPAAIGISLTENKMMIPSASVCGLLFANPSSRYFPVGEIAQDQLTIYAEQRKLSPETLLKFIR